MSGGVGPLARRMRLYRAAHGQWPPLLRPRTFSEKVNWRISFDRRPLLWPTCDKLAMKEYALAAGAAVTVPRTFWTGTDLAALAAVELPAHWVLKPNHSCRRVHFGSGPADPEELAVRTRGWVEERYWRDSEEWAYRRARPGLLVEELIGDPGETLVDYKVLVFDGTPRLIGVHEGRGEGHRSRYYTPDWEPLPWTDGHRRAARCAAPERLAEMLAAAAVLARDFDMLRVDFYEHQGVLWFGELTPYPGAGLSALDPELDVLLGSWWALPPVSRMIARR